MKKYLFGLTALMIAVCLNSFTIAGGKKINEVATSDMYQFYGTTSADYTNPAMWDKVTVVSVECDASGPIACVILVDTGTGIADEDDLADYINTYGIGGTGISIIQEKN